MHQHTNQKETYAPTHKILAEKRNHCSMIKDCNAREPAHRQTDCLTLHSFQRANNTHAPHTEQHFPHLGY